ncbi:MAG TPA: TIGR01777 family oxidoreductase [Acidobacteriota bacterium]|nr:TIGR01777 family oxidoreductase [Acidobacteriota bacterium]
MRCLVSGSTGLIGSSLVPYFQRQGHEIKRLVRRASTSPDEATLESLSQPIDAVVHLAGESIIGRWNAEKKDAIRKSRIEGTRALVNALSKLSTPPRVLVSASAIGFYGNRGSEWLTEESPPGNGFLPEVCQEWERAASEISATGTRSAMTRFGIILSSKGGALKQMLTPFKIGVGGKIGSGNQYFSWISIDDAVRAIYHIVMTESLQGPVNLVTPTPVTNAEFTRILAKVLKRPAIFPMPKAAAKVAFGEMADELLLASARVSPAKLLQSGYPYQYPELEGTFRHLLDQ